MREIGCLMTDPMQRANLSGDKTVTRRIGKTWARARVGDRLWFREVWKPVVAPDDSSGYLYRCDGRFERIADTMDAAEDWCRLYANKVGGTKLSSWRSSLLMPRSVCRATGIITSIGQVPLQDIDETDAIREGMGMLTMSDLESLGSRRDVLIASRSARLIGINDYNWLMRDKRRKDVDVIWESVAPYWDQIGPRDRFQLGFSLIHSPETWRQNPLVWRVEWRRE